MTKIDIILPYFNGSKYIKEQIDSILENELRDINLNLIVINDASSDSETKYLKSILPAECQYFENEKNLGVIKTIEKGLTISQAPYIMLCDQDDVWLPKKIKNTLNFMLKVEENSPCLVYTDLAIVDEQLNLMHQSMHKFYRHNHNAIKPSIIFHNIVTGCTVMINKKLLNLALPMPSQITMHDHWLALVAVFGGKIKFLDEVTILYRQHGRNQVGASQKSNLDKILNFRETLPRFNSHLKMKENMAKQLGNRLREAKIESESKLVNEIVFAIQSKNVLFLFKSGAVRGDLLRIIGVCSLIILKRQISAFFDQSESFQS